MAVKTQGRSFGRAAFLYLSDLLSLFVEYKNINRQNVKIIHPKIFMGFSKGGEQHHSKKAAPWGMGQGYTRKKLAA